MDERIREAAEGFDFGGCPVEARAYGSGHIHDTFLLRVSLPDGSEKAVILQRMNRNVFGDPAPLMENIVQVTAHLRQKILEQGGDPERETLTVYPARSGKPFLTDGQGGCWRAYRFIEGASSYDAVRRPQDFSESGAAFGRFQRLLADFPAERLRETIPGFHDTNARFARLLRAVREDRMGRAGQVGRELSFLMERRERAGVLADMRRQGRLPLRVTHNDTKLNNVLLDDRTGKGLCVIDLDTVMPGLSAHDFGDAIRFGANTAAEDERDLSRVGCDLRLFAAFTRGFLAGCGGALTREEVEALVPGAEVMTLECGIRFLTDYLEGDTYFKTSRPGQNLDRCRTQLALAADMEAKRDRLRQIVAEEAQRR